MVSSDWPTVSNVSMFSVSRPNFRFSNHFSLSIGAKTSRFRVVVGTCLMPSLVVTGDFLALELDFVSVQTILICFQLFGFLKMYSVYSVFV